MEIRADGLTFPAYGQYNVAGPFGVAKLLLLNPANDRDDEILAIGRFVAAISYHSGIDTYLRHDGARSFPVFLNAILQKVFHSDQPIGLWCNEVVDVLAFLLHQRGHSSRKLHLVNPTDVRHTCLEVFLPTAGRWVLVDLTYDVMLKHNGAFLSGREVRDLRSAGKVSAIELAPLAGKGWSGHDIPSSATGQVTWTPDFDGWRVDHDAFYRDVIIGRGFADLQYASYEFGSAATTRSGPTVTTIEIDP